MNRNKGYMNIELFQKIIDETSPYLLNLILYFQGEPYTNPLFIKMIKYASIEKGIFTTTSTNGHFLSNLKAKETVESGLNRLIVSIDGTTQEIYERYRKGGNLELVKQNIKNVVRWKKELKSKTPQIIMQFIVFQFNEHQIPEVYKLAKELNVDKVELKSAQIYNFEHDSTLIPSVSKYSRYKQNSGGSYEIKSKLKNQCQRLWESTVITWDGKLIGCCFDKDGVYSSGNVKNNSFKNIQNNNKSKEFRKKILQNRKQFSICRNCTSGLYR